MWEYISGSLAKPVQTLRSAAENNLWKQGLIIVAVLSILKGSTATTVMRNEELLSLLETTMSISGQELLLSFLQSPLLVITLTLISGIFQWLLAGVLFHLFAKLFKGQGTLSGILASTGYAQSPNFIGIPLNALLSISTGAGSAILSGIVSFGIGIWVFVLDIIAIKETYRISTVAATATFFIPFILLFIITLFLIGMLTAVLYFIPIL